MLYLRNDVCRIILAREQPRVEDDAPDFFFICFHKFGNFPAISSSAWSLKYGYIFVGSSSDIVTEPSSSGNNFLLLSVIPLNFDFIGKIGFKQILFRERQVQYSKLLLSGLLHYHASKVSRKLSLVFEFIDQLRTDDFEVSICQMN